MKEIIYQITLWLNKVVFYYGYEKYILFTLRASFRKVIKMQ